MGIEYIDLDEVERWPRNPKKHDIPRIKKSIKKHGFTIPLARDATTGMLVAGHGRLQSLRELRDEGADVPERILVDPKTKRWFVPVLLGLSFESEEAAEEYLLTDNRLVEAGGWDPEMLTKIFKEMPRERIEASGFSDADVTRLAKVAAANLVGPAAEPVSFTPQGKDRTCPNCGHNFKA